MVNRDRCKESSCRQCRRCFASAHWAISLPCYHWLFDQVAEHESDPILSSDESHISECYTMASKGIRRSCKGDVQNPRIIRYEGVCQIKTWSMGLTQDQNDRQLVSILLEQSTIHPICSDFMARSKDNNLEGHAFSRLFYECVAWLQGGEWHHSNEGAINLASKGIAPVQS